MTHSAEMVRSISRSNIFAVSILAAALAGCATVAPPPPELERIVYRPGSSPFCWDACESREIIVAADGRIWIETSRLRDNVPEWRDRTEADWRTDTRILRTTPDVYSRVRDALAPFKPATQTIRTHEGENCANFIEDQGEAWVTWIDQSGALTRIFEAGCLDDRGMNRAVDAAFDDLPIPR